MEEEKTLRAIDININKVESSNSVAYYRIDQQFKDFLKKCEDKHKIIGFEYNGSFNFGIILVEKLNNNL